MNLLADENIPIDLVRKLRSEGYETQILAEIRMLGAEDSEILQNAVSRNLTIITEDKDFGYLIEFSEADTSARAILLRYDIFDVEKISKELLVAIKKIEMIVPTGRMMAVLSNGKLRIREWKDT